MPWIAEQDGTRVIPEEVDAREDVRCPECGGRMRVRAESIDGRARHFFHIGKMGGGEAAGNTCKGISGGESDTHRKLKSLATSRLRGLFADLYETCEVEYRVGEDCDLPSGKVHRDMDAVVKFDDSHNPWGKGIAVEVQYKNFGKDIEETERDYFECGYSVYWASEADFEEDRCTITKGDIEREATRLWPNAVPDWSLKSLYYEDWYNVLAGSWAYDVPEEMSRPDWQLYLASMGLSVEEAFTRPIIQAKLPPEWVDEHAEKIWRNQRWLSLFTPPEEYLDIWGYSKVPATLPDEWVESAATELWHETDWNSKFRGKSHAPVSFDGAQHVPCTYYLSKWIADDDSVLYANKGRRGWSLGVVSVEEFSASPPAERYMIPASILEKLSKDKHYQRSVANPPSKPQSPFDDVQCWSCGTYWHISKDYSECPDCGTAVDMDWNRRTGRIS